MSMCSARLCTSRRCKGSKFWFRDVDSNHDTQLQRLMSYRLDDPGTGQSLTSLAEEESACIPAPTFVPGIYEYTHRINRDYAEVWRVTTAPRLACAERPFRRSG